MLLHHWSTPLPNFPLLHWITNHRFYGKDESSDLECSDTSSNTTLMALDKICLPCFIFILIFSAHFYFVQTNVIRPSTSLWISQPLRWISRQHCRKLLPTQSHCHNCWVKNLLLVFFINLLLVQLLIFSIKVLHSHPCHCGYLSPQPYVQCTILNWLMTTTEGS